MKFSDQKFFYYEEGFWHGNTLADVFRNGRDSSAGLFTLSGLADLRDAMLIVDEWYHQHPKVTFKELRKSGGDNPITVDDLDHEPESGVREYNRVLDLHAHIEQEGSEYSLGKTGDILKQNVVAHLGLFQLMEMDWWPTSGDQLWYMGRLHDVRTIHAEPQSYWQHSGIPMHLTVRTEIAQYGDHEPPRRALDLQTHTSQPAILLPPPQPLS